MTRKILHIVGPSLGWAAFLYPAWAFAFWRIDWPVAAAADARAVFAMVAVGLGVLTSACILAAEAEEGRNR